MDDNRPNWLRQTPSGYGIPLSNGAEPDVQATVADRREAAANAVRDYLRADTDRCMPTCRVGCPCDGGMEDAATGAGDAAQEIVSLVLETMDAKYARLREAAQAVLDADERYDRSIGQKRIVRRAELVGEIENMRAVMEADHA